MDPVSSDSLPGGLASLPGPGAIFDRPERKIDPKETALPFHPLSMVFGPIPVLIDQSPPKAWKISQKDVVVHPGRNRKLHNRKW